MQTSSGEANRNVIRSIAVILNDGSTRRYSAIGQTCGCSLELVTARGESSTGFITRLQRKKKFYATFGGKLKATVRSKRGRSLTAAVSKRQQMAATRMNATDHLHKPKLRKRNEIQSKNDSALEKLNVGRGEQEPLQQDNVVCRSAGQEQSVSPGDQGNEV
jgi:hypothetical protein